MCFMLSAYRICIKLYTIPPFLATHYYKNLQKDVLDVSVHKNRDS